MKKTILMSALALLTLCLPASAQTAQPFTVPTMHNWKATSQTLDLSNRTAFVPPTDASLEPAITLLEQALRGSIPVYSATKKAPYDNAITFRLELVKNKKLGNEGYQLSIDAKRGVSIKAQTPTGIVWGVQTLAQMVEGNPKELPCGMTTDVPEYKLRGFMIDCGRKHIPMSYLRTLVRCMSHYKMNCLQVHLNDNGFRKYFHNNWDETYAAFRLESELFPELTARDGYYTKKEFREFVKWAATLGVEIIPEIDAPAHALAFVHFRPEFGNQEFGVDHLDLSNPGVIPFLDSLYNEYLEGPDPVFAGPRVHIGTDEYSNKRQETIEQFRAFTSHYIQLVKKHGKQPKLWGSLTWCQGTTPIESEGVIMDMWSNMFAKPDSMKSLGYQMVSIPDGWVYIVPAAGYYYDYLYDEMLYQKWTPANINGVQFAEHDPQIEGGMFAVWNDVCGNGISTYDIHHRFMPALQVMAQKCWSATHSTLPYADWNKARQNLHDEVGYSWGRMPYREAVCAQLRPNELVTLTPTTTGGKAFTLQDVGYPYSVSFDVTAGKEERGALLFRSDFAEFYLADPVTGSIGFVRDGYAFNFNYALRPGEKHTLRIEGDNKQTSLYVDGKLKQTLGYDERLAADKKPYNVVRTLAFPLQRTGNYRSTVSNLRVTYGK